MTAKTMDDLLREIDSGDTASAGAGGETKTASAGGDNEMSGLMELYNSTFTPETKTAAARPAAPAQHPQQPAQQPKQAAQQKTAEERKLHKMGMVAGAVFNQQFDQFLFKFAMEDIASREADNSKPAVGDPQLPVNKPSDAAAPIDTTPVYADEDEQLLAETIPANELLNRVTQVGKAETHGGNVDLGLEEPAKQAP